MRSSTLKAIVAMLLVIAVAVLGTACAIYVTAAW